MCQEELPTSRLENYDNVLLAYGELVKKIRLLHMTLCPGRMYTDVDQAIEDILERTRNLNHKP